MLKKPRRYPKAIWLRWWNSNLKGCLFLAFFPIPLSHAKKKLDFFFSIVCRSESLRQKLFCLLHWATATNRFFCLLHWVTVTNKVCICSGKKPKKVPKMLHILVLFAIFSTFCYFLAFCMPFFVFFSKNSTHFGLLCAIYTNFVCRSDSVRQTKNSFVVVTQGDKQNKSLSQWLSVTNNIEKNIQLICGTRQRNWKKSPKQTCFQIWISPPLSNYFGVLSRHVSLIKILKYNFFQLGLTHMSTAVCPSAR